MRITTVRCIQLNIPEESRAAPTAGARTGWDDRSARSRPIHRYPEFSRVKVTKYPLVWVQVIAENGEFGLGRCPNGEPVAALIDYHIAPLIEGRDALAIELANDLMWRANEPYQGGIAASAQSGVDIALWDLKGKLLERPVYELLGGPCRDYLELYATGDDLEWMMEQGFTAFKISNPFFYEEGSEGLAQLAEHVAKSRETVGDEAELMINPTMSYNVDMALRVAERLRPFNLRWFEEPRPATDIEGHVELKRAVTWVPIATGEHNAGRRQFRQLIERRATDIVQPDLEWAGGLSETAKIYTIAEAAGIGMSPHTGANTAWGQHFAMAFPEATVSEWFIDTDVGAPMGAKLPPGVAGPVNGKITPSEAPGFGLEIPEAWIGPWDHAGQIRRPHLMKD